MYRYSGNICGLMREWLPLRVRAFFGWASMWIATIIVFAIGNAVAFAIS